MMPRSELLDERCYDSSFCLISRCTSSSSLLLFRLLHELMRELTSPISVWHASIYHLVLSVELDPARQPLLGSLTTLFFSTSCTVTSVTSRIRTQDTSLVGDRTLSDTSVSSLGLGTNPCASLSVLGLSS
jgi:hypothetical protein